MPAMEARDDPADGSGRVASHEGNDLPRDGLLKLLLRYNLWPVAIKPGEKAPIGESWGSTRPTERSIRETFKRLPKAGVGLLLGPEAGIIDIECDGPEGVDSLAKLLGGEIILTLGWSSARGPHHVFRYDDRLARYGKSIIKLPELPGLEIRNGGNGKRLQSNCPPTIGSDGKPREWKGTRSWPTCPRPSSRSWMLHWPSRIKRSREFRHRRVETMERDRDIGTCTPTPTKALDEECQKVALARRIGEQNETLNKAAFALGQLVGAGVSIAPSSRTALDGGRRRLSPKGRGNAKPAKTIQSGLKAGQTQPRDLSHLNSDRNGHYDAERRDGKPTGPPPWPPLRFSEPPPALPFPVDVFPAGPANLLP